MMDSSNAPASSSRRRSGRVKTTQQNPAEDGDSSQASANKAKRKRAGAPGCQDETDGGSSSSESSDEEEADSVEDGWHRGSRKTGKAESVPTRKPASKRPKTNGGEMKSLPVRSAVNGTKSMLKKAKLSQRIKPKSRVDPTSDKGETDLFTKVQNGLHPDQLAADWVTHYNDEATAAMRDLINFVLKCAGCNFEVDVHDIEDPDNAPSKLEDLQEQYYAQEISDYPLVAKGKGSAALRTNIVDFIHSLLATVNAANVLHDDPAVMENVAVWLTSMSDSTLRPFRHTATLVALAMGTTLCTLAFEYSKTIATFMRQKETESKNKKKVNQDRIRLIDAKIKQSEERREEIQRLIVESIFDTVFAHRYRDVEPRIRLECASVLGSWISYFPDVFFTGQYIRYYGWLLSDSSAATRAEVLKQLSKLYRLENAVGNLRAFTERFRPRMVEMAVRDAEPGIRAASIDLLGQLRQLGLLEPDDIDKVGRLIFDSDPRVRKAVTPFIRQNIDDLVEDIVDELGGDETLDEFFGEEAEDDFDRPRRAWLDYKGLTETLQAYDAEETEKFASNPEDGLSAKEAESRYGLAAQAIVDGLGGSDKWEVLAGYLLYDLSVEDGTSSETEKSFKQRCSLDEKEQQLLLEFLHVSVRSRVIEAVKSEVDKKGKSSKGRAAKSTVIQERTTLHLSRTIPKLLQKFSADPISTAAILRLGQVLNLETFHAMRQDSTAYAALLDDINKQFITHTNHRVISEASTTLLHARTFGDLEDTADEKMLELWATTIASFRASIGADEISLPDLVDALRRLSSLASMSDCTGVFKPKPNTSISNEEPVIDSLIRLIADFGTRDWATDNDQLIGDTVVTYSIKCLLLYYMWTVRSHGTAYAYEKRDSPTGPALRLPSDFAAALLEIIEMRRPATSTICLVAAETYLDLYTLFATRREMKSRSSDPTAIEHIPIEAYPLLFHVLNSSLKHFARKLDRKLEPDRGDDPVFQDDEDHAPVSDDDEEEDELDDGPSEEKKAAILVAEKHLCELTGKYVLAIVARVLDHDGDSKGKIKNLMIRNKMNLGPNFKEVLNFLDAPKVKAKRKPRAKRAPGKKQPETVELEDDPIEDEEDPGQASGEDEEEEEIDVGGNGAQDGAGPAIAGAQEDRMDDEFMGD